MCVIKFCGKTVTLNSNKEENTENILEAFKALSEKCLVCVDEMTYSLSLYHKLLNDLEDKKVLANFEVVKSYIASGKFSIKAMTFDKKKVDEGISRLPLDKSKDLENRLDDVEI